MAELTKPPSAMRQYAILLRVGLASAMQYRADFVMTAVGAICYEAVSLAFVGVIVYAFGSIGGWSLVEVAFVYGIRSMGHALHGILSGQLWTADGVVRRGEFDRYLLRPVNPLIQLLARRFQVTAVGDIVFGAVVLAVTAVAAPISWSLASVVFLIAAVIGSALVESAVMLAIASLTFRLLASSPILSVADTVFVTFGPYPLSVLPRTVAHLLTFVLPLAYAAFFPAAVLLDRTTELFVPTWLAFASPVVGLLLYAAAVLFFHRQMRHYSSPGH
ncbi:ABC transporter permease [Actinopolymorpha alba]|uniref:ABC transporter permease n=1 Tax=Actinopolymorpha alba TaxID=533267 RepID=UPI00037D7FC7|nr:ABC-2 family transporter protein [Actinopolymorpha alba]